MSDFRPDVRSMEVTRLGPAAGSRVAIVGGAGGIGMATVSACLENELQVAVLDLPASLDRRALPAEIITMPVDARDEPQVAAAFGAIGDVWDGELDGLINLAGYADPLTTLEDRDMRAFDDVVAANLRAATLTCRAALPLLRAASDGAGSSSIVNMSSGLARVARAGYGPYSIAKAGILALTRTLSNENAPAVRANAVTPGGIDTAFLRGGFAHGGGEDGPATRFDVSEYEKMVPMGRIGVPQDVVGPMLFLLSDAARYITGTTLDITGGA